MAQTEIIPADAWRPNQRVILVKSSSSELLVRRNQAHSTPGVIAEMPVKKGDQYTFKVRVKGNCRLKLHIADEKHSSVSVQPINVSIDAYSECSTSFFANQDGVIFVGVLMRSLHDDDCSKPYSEKFSIASATLTRVERRTGIVASMATMPSRIDSLPATITSIYHQVDHLFIHLNGFDSTPEFLKLPNISVTRSQDLGDLKDTGKFLGLREVDDDTTFFTIDDDIIYPSNYVQQLTSCLNRFDRRVIVGVHGVIYPYSPKSFFDRMTLHFKRQLPVDLPVSCLGTGTVAFHTRCFRPEISDFEQHGMADLYVAALAKRANIPLISVSRRTNWLMEAKSPEGPEESLYQETKRDSIPHQTVLGNAGNWGFAQIDNSLSGISDTVGGSGLSDEANAFVHYGKWIEGGCHGFKPRVPFNETSVALASLLGLPSFLREAILS